MSTWKSNPRSISAFVLIFGLIVSIHLGALGSSGFAREKDPTPREGFAKVSARPAPEFKAHNISNLWNVVTNYGSFGDPEFENTGRPSMAWPGGSKNRYLYDASIMVSTKLSGEKVNTAYFYYWEEWEPSDGSTFLMGNDNVSTLFSPVSIQDSWAEFDDLPEETEHTPIGVKVQRHGLSWSVNNYNNFIAYQLDIINLGLNGDLNDVYISFWYDLDVSSIDVSDAHIDDLVDFDGWDGSDTETDEVDIVDPHDLDADGETGYDEFGIPFADQRNVPSDGGDVGYQPERSEPDGVYDEYSLILDPNGPPVLADAAVTIGEMEIAAGDTLKYQVGQDYKTVYGYKVPRGLSYMYDADNPTSSDNDMGERELNPSSTGFVGGRAIYADPAESDFVFEVQDSARQRIVRPFSHQWWNWESDPDNDAEMYDYITGQHEFSQGYKYLPNPLDVGAPTFDYRYLHSLGPYDIPAGDTVKVVWIEGIGLGLQGLRETMDNAMIAYYTGSKQSSPYVPSAPNEDVHWLLPTPPPAPTLNYSPGDSEVKLVWDNIAEITPDTKTGKIDFAGYKIYRAKYSPSNWTLIGIMYDLSMFDGDSVYVTNTVGDTLGAIHRNDAPIVQNEFIDDGGETSWGTMIEAPINGLPYYYAVVAYDVGEPDAGIPPAESGKSNYKKNEAGAPVGVIPKRVYGVENQDDYDLTKIKVVPNPYKGTGVFEDVYESRIVFTNLPPAAKISIFSLTGDLIERIMHTDGTNSETWDLLSRNDQKIVSGMYVYVVETEDDKFIGKFVVVR